MKNSDSKLILFRKVLSLFIIIAFTIIAILGGYKVVEAKQTPETYSFRYTKWQDMSKFQVRSQIAKIVVLNNTTHSYVRDLDKDESFDLDEGHKIYRNNKNNRGLYVICLSVGETLNQGSGDYNTTSTNQKVHTTRKSSLYRSVGITFTNTYVSDRNLKSYFRKHGLGDISTKKNKWYEFDNNNGWRVENKKATPNTKILTVEEETKRTSSTYWTMKSFVIQWADFRNLCKSNKIDLAEHANKGQPIYMHCVMQRLSGGRRVGDKYYYSHQKLSSAIGGAYYNSLKSYYNNKVYLPAMNATVYVDSVYVDENGKVRACTGNAYSYEKKAHVGSSLRVHYRNVGEKEKKFDKSITLPVNNVYSNKYQLYSVKKVSKRSTKEILDGKAWAATGKNFDSAFNNKVLKKSKDKYTTYLNWVTKMKSASHRVMNSKQYYQLVYKSSPVDISVKVEVYNIEAGKTVNKAVLDTKNTKTYQFPYQSVYSPNALGSSNKVPYSVKIGKKSPTSGKTTYKLYCVKNDAGNKIEFFPKGNLNVSDMERDTSTYTNNLDSFYTKSATLTKPTVIRVYYLATTDSSSVKVQYVNKYTGKLIKAPTGIKSNPYTFKGVKQGVSFQASTSTYKNSGDPMRYALPKSLIDNNYGGQAVYACMLEVKTHSSNGNSNNKVISASGGSDFNALNFADGKFTSSFVTGDTYKKFYNNLLSYKFKHYKGDGGTTITVYYSPLPGNVTIHYKKYKVDGSNMTSLKGKTWSSVAAGTLFKFGTSHSGNANPLVGAFYNRGTGDENSLYLQSVEFRFSEGSGTNYQNSCGKSGSSFDLTYLNSSAYKTWLTQVKSSTVQSPSNKDKPGNLDVYLVYAKPPTNPSTVKPVIKYVDSQYNLLEDPFECDAVSVPKKYQFYPTKYIRATYDSMPLVDWKITTGGEESVWTNTTLTDVNTNKEAKNAEVYNANVTDAINAKINLTSSNATLWLVYDYNFTVEPGEPYGPDVEVFEDPFEAATSGDVSANIYADDENNDGQKYSVESEDYGIPTSDKVGTRATAKRYVSGYRYKTTTGGYEYNVSFFYHNGTTLDSVDVTINREYKYNEVVDLDIAKADKTVIENEVLGPNATNPDGGKNTVYFENDDVSVQYTKRSSSMTTPVVKSDADISSIVSTKAAVKKIVTTSDRTGIGILVDRQISQDDAKALAEQFFTNYVTESDELIGQVYQQDGVTKESVQFMDKAGTKMLGFYVIPTGEVSEVGSVDEDTVVNDADNAVDDNAALIEDGVDVVDTVKEAYSALDKTVSDKAKNTNIVVPDELRNGEHLSKATTYYVDALPDSNVHKSVNADHTVPTDCNNVFVHTPVVSTAHSSVDTDNPSILQAINLDVNDVNVSLGKTFKLDWSVNGLHKDAPGYETRDYSRYVKEITVVCPFEVKYEGKYFNKGEEITVFDKDKDGAYDVSKCKVKGTFEVPLWTPTGSHQILVKVYALNATTPDRRSMTEDNANTEMKNYVAVGSATVNVYGNVYGFQIYDISDYPTWQSVFRKKDSLQLTGRSYTVGTRTMEGNDNGHSKRATLPIIKGSHPTIESAGPLNRGYAFRYRLTTTGSMTDLDDSISIVPKFYYVKKDGTEMQEVDLYYNQTINNRKTHLVKVGSVLDKSNKKYLQTGDKYLSIPEKELSKTATLSGISLSSFKALNKSVYSYGNIKLPYSLRTFVGRDKAYYTLDGTDNGVGSLVPHASDATINKSIQRWYGEYYLPSDVNAVPKGFDVAAYGNTTNVDFTESFWLKDGYIVVNFDIETDNAGDPELSYNPGTIGTVNMWNREGYQINRIDSTGAAFEFHEGDCVLYDTNHSASTDYDSSGTH